jgi:hypothetical protein
MHVASRGNALSSRCIHLFRVIPTCKASLGSSADRSRPNSAWCQRATRELSADAAPRLGHRTRPRRVRRLPNCTLMQNKMSARIRLVRGKKSDPKCTFVHRTQRLCTCTGSLFFGSVAHQEPSVLSLCSAIESVNDGVFFQQHMCVCGDCMISERACEQNRERMRQQRGASRSSGSSLEQSVRAIVRAGT